MTTKTTDTNGRQRKSLAEQIDRLDTILDTLGEGLNEAVAAAVEQAVEQAVRAGVRQGVSGALAEMLTNPDVLAALRAALAPEAPPAQPRRPHFGGAEVPVLSLQQRVGPAPQVERRPGQRQRAQPHHASVLEHAHAHWLGSGLPAARSDDRLPLLPSGSDGVHGPFLHRTRSSTPPRARRIRDAGPREGIQPR